MHRYGIEEETWFEAARTGLERRGFRLRLQQRSLVVEKEGRLPRIVASAVEFLEFAERQGVRIETGAMEVASRYGDGQSDLSGRASDSPFETPVVGGVPEPEPAGLGGVAEATRPELGALERRLTELRAEQDHQAAQRRGARSMADEHRLLQARCAALEAALAQALAQADETAKQRDLYQMSAAAAEDRLRSVQAELDGPPEDRGPDKRFNQLRRFLARELHPDLAGEDAAERRVREAIFKRVWARIEQLQ